MCFTWYIALLLLFLRWSKEMYTWTVDPGNFPCPSPATLTYPSLKSHALNFQLFRPLKHWRKHNWIPVAPQVVWFKMRGKESSGVELFLWKLTFQKHICIENEGFLWNILAVLYFLGLTQAKRQPLRSHFQIWPNSQRQYPNLHPGMKLKQNIAQNASCKKAWSASQQQHATPAESNPNPQPNYAGPELRSALGTENRQSNGQRIFNINLDALLQLEQPTWWLWTKGVWEPQLSPQKETAWVWRK